MITNNELNGQVYHREGPGQLISLLAGIVVLFERVEASCKTIRINADDDG